MKTLNLRTPATIDDLLNYRLVRLHGVSGKPVIRLMEGRFGIARREWRILASLAASGPMSPSQLAQATMLDRPRTSLALRRLMDKGLVARQVVSGDARRAWMSLTPAGQGLYDEAFPLVADIHRSLVACLSDDELRTLVAALDALTTRAHAVNEDMARDVQANRRSGGTRRSRPLDALPR